MDVKLVLSVVQIYFLKLALFDSYFAIRFTHLKILVRCDIGAKVFDNDTEIILTR